MSEKPSRLVSFHADVRGLTTVEYAIVLSLVAAAAVAAWSRFGDDIDGYLRRANVEIRDQLAPGKD